MSVPHRTVYFLLSVSWNVADIPDQSGRVAVVTGANGGLGLETARALAGAGAHVVMASRNQEKAMRAEDDVRRGLPAASLSSPGIAVEVSEGVTAASRRPPPTRPATPRSARRRSRTRE